jgi:hypothetical protein
VGEFGFGFGIGAATFMVLGFVVGVKAHEAGSQPPHTLRCYEQGRLVLKADARVLLPNEDGEPKLYTGGELEVAGCKVTGRE